MTAFGEPKNRKGEVSKNTDIGDISRLYQTNNIQSSKKGSPGILVGGLEHELYFSIGKNHHPN